MKRKKMLYLLILLIMVFTLLYILLKCSDHNDGKSEQWIGNYSFYEFAEPNQNMIYSISIYEDNGLYARIKIDGFSTMDRLIAKVWSHGDEIEMTFYDYYIDENGGTTLLERFDEGNFLLKFTRKDGVLITEWGGIQPLLIKNEVPGQYFTKDVEK